VIDKIGCLGGIRYCGTNAVSIFIGTVEEFKAECVIVGGGWTELQGQLVTGQVQRRPN
jgi:hypothetical protein